MSFRFKAGEFNIKQPCRECGKEITIVNKSTHKKLAKCEGCPTKKTQHNLVRHYRYNCPVYPEREEPKMLKSRYCKHKVRQSYLSFYAFLSIPIH